MRGAGEEERRVELEGERNSGDLGAGALKRDMHGARCHHGEASKGGENRV